MASSKFIIVQHEAKRAGKHWDLRFQIPGDKNWASFAIRKPPDTIKPGEKIGAIRTHLHSEKEALFLGTIESGYGAGELKEYDSGSCDVIKYTSKSIVVNFHGRKLKGVYNLLQIKNFDKSADPKMFIFFKGKQLKENTIMNKKVDKLVDLYLKEEEDLQTDQPNEENEIPTGEEPTELSDEKAKDEIVDELTEDLLNSEEFNYLSEDEKKWIQGAVKRPGALHKALGVKQGEKIPAKKLKVKKTDSTKLKRMKILAKTLKKLRHKGKKD